MRREFENPQNLPGPVLRARLEALDPLAECRIGIVQLWGSTPPQDPEGPPNPEPPLRYFVEVESAASDVDIEAALAAPIAVEETALLTRYLESRGHAAAIPNWATWTEAQALDWWNANLSDAQVDAITSLAQAKPLLKKQNDAIRALARMVIAMRDKLWPDL